MTTKHNPNEFILTYYHHGHYYKFSILQIDATHYGIAMKRLIICPEASQHNQITIVFEPREGWFVFTDKQRRIDCLTAIALASMGKIDIDGKRITELEYPLREYEQSKREDKISITERGRGIEHG